MINKKAAKLRRSLKTRAHIRKLNVKRLSVHKTSQHIYASISTPSGDQVLVAASTVDKELKGQLNNGGNIAAANAVGKLLAERAKAKGISKVAFDKSGYRYQGRIKALADSARESGMLF